MSKIDEVEYAYYAAKNPSASGTTRDLKNLFYIQQTAVTNIKDGERAWLKAQGAVGNGIDELWQYYLTAQGYTGTLLEKKIKFFIDNATSNPDLLAACNLSGEAWVESVSGDGAFVTNETDGTRYDGTAGMRMSVPASKLNLAMQWDWTDKDLSAFTGVKLTFHTSSLSGLDFAQILLDSVGASFTNYYFRNLTSASDLSTGKNVYTIPFAGMTGVGGSRNLNTITRLRLRVQATVLGNTPIGTFSNVVRY